MAALITTNIITTVAQISEADLRARLGTEVLDQLGLLDSNGLPIAGVTLKVMRGDGGVEKGGYVVSVIRDLTKDTRARLAAPETEAAKAVM